MQPIDIQRVRGELKWDGIPLERAAAKVICIREESERRIANISDAFEVFICGHIYLPVKK